MHCGAYKIAVFSCFSPLRWIISGWGNGPTHLGLTGILFILHWFLRSPASHHEPSLSQFQPCLVPHNKWSSGPHFFTGANSPLELSRLRLCDGWLPAVGSQENYLRRWSTKAAQSWWVVVVVVHARGILLHSFRRFPGWRENLEAHLSYHISGYWLEVETNSSQWSPWYWNGNEDMSITNEHYFATFLLQKISSTWKFILLVSLHNNDTFLMWSRKIYIKSHMISE